MYVTSRYLVLLLTNYIKASLVYCCVLWLRPRTMGGTKLLDLTGPRRQIKVDNTTQAKK